MSEPQTQISTSPGEQGNANLVYILYLVGIAVGLTTLIGVIMAYVAKDSSPDLVKSHYHNQINIFWKGLLYGVISAVLTPVIIGFLLLFALLVWYIVRTVKGMQALAKGQPYPNPASWGF